MRPGLTPSVDLLRAAALMMLPRMSALRCRCTTRGHGDGADRGMIDQSSVTGFQEIPASVVFHNPPPVAPCVLIGTRASLPATAIDRPPRPCATSAARQMDRRCRAPPPPRCAMAIAGRRAESNDIFHMSDMP